MKSPIRSYITKSKAGHYTVTVRALKPWGTMGVVAKENFIDNLQLAQEAAAKYIAEYQTRVNQ